MANLFKFRADHLGGLIVPQRLQQARRDYVAGAIDQNTLQKIEEQCVVEVLDMQAKATIDVFSDGELLRGDYCADLKAALSEGVERVEQIARSQAETLRREVDILKRNIKNKGTNYNFKVSLVAPGFLIGQCYRSMRADEAGDAARAIAERLVPIVREEIQFLLSNNVPYIQMINPSYGCLLATGNHGALQDKSVEPKAVLEEVMAADIPVYEEAERSSDAVIGQIICEGAPEPWFRSEGHEALAETLFSGLPVDRFNVIFGDVRSVQVADFQSLRLVPEEKVVSAGLLDAADTKIEDVDSVLDRLDEIDEVHEQQSLSLCIHGDFRSHGDESAQFSKLQLAASLARQYWGFEM